MTTHTNILLIDDDVELVQLLSEYLISEGFQVQPAYDYRTGLTAALANDIAIVVLDTMLPGGSGLDLLRVLRSTSTVPVLLLTARGDATDRVIGLDSGADDYLPKPYDPRELLARIRAILRRTYHPGQREAEWICEGDFSLYPTLRRAMFAGKQLDLTPVEFNVLKCLVSKRGAVVCRERLAQAALGRHTGLLDRSIDVHISRIRRKFERLGAMGDFIQAVRGEGYMFTEVRRQPCPSTNPARVAS